MNNQINKQNLDMLIGLLVKETKDLSIKNAVSIFFNHNHGRIREKSIKTYEDLLVDILNYFKDLNITYISQINVELVNKFSNHCKNKGNSNLTINSKIDTLSRIFNLMVKLGHLTDNPLIIYEKLPEHKKPIETIKNSESELIINLAKEQANKGRFESIRNYILLLIIFEQGIRINECINIQVRNIFFNQNRIFLSFTKTGYPRDIRLSDYTMCLLKDYINTFKIKDYIACNKQQTNLINNRNFRRYLEDMQIKLGITTSISPHKWRHSFASESLKQGANIKYIQEVLGHTSLKTTEIYLHIDNDFKDSQAINFSRLKNINIK